jgi:hypothetical protein
MKESGQGGKRIGRDEMPGLHRNATGGLATASEAENQNVPLLFLPKRLSKLSLTHRLLADYFRGVRQSLLQTNR